jgi:hypothetical protein
VQKLHIRANAVDSNALQVRTHSKPKVWDTLQAWINK